jgi:hypothetical protein
MSSPTSARAGPSGGPLKAPGYTRRSSARSSGGRAASVMHLNDMRQPVAYPASSGPVLLPLRQSGPASPRPTASTSSRSLCRLRLPGLAIVVCTSSLPTPCVVYAQLLERLPARGPAPDVRRDVLVGGDWSALARGRSFSSGTRRGCTENLGLDSWMALEYTTCSIENSARCTGQGSQGHRGGNDCGITSPARRKGWGGCFCVV